MELSQSALGMFTTANPVVKLRTNLKRTPVFCNPLKVERTLFLEAGLAKWERQKWMQMLERLGEENKPESN